MQTAFYANIEFATPPLRQEKRVIVTSFAELQRLKEIAAAEGFRVASYGHQDIYTADDVARFVAREKLETERAINGGANPARTPVEGV